METVIRDLRYGFRVLLKRRAFSIVAVITLALGIGANTAIFSVVNAVMLRPLPYRQPDRIVALWENLPGNGSSKWRVTPANFLDWKKQNQSFEEMGAFSAMTLNLTEGGEPEQIMGARISDGYFSTLGVAPLFGRSFLPEEYEEGKGHVIILGHGLWQRRFGADPQIVGKTITLDSTSFSVVGVMPQAIYPTWPTNAGRMSFGANQQQFWIPITLTADWSANRRSHFLGVVGRLKGGVTIKQAEAEMATIARRLGQTYAENKGAGIYVNPLLNEVIGSVRPALIALLGAVAFVLLIACANVTSLLLAQLAARRKEIAIRAALGASRARLIRQFFFEGIWLALLGGAVGIWLANFGIDLLVKIIPQGIPRLSDVRLDLSVMGFTLLLSVITSLMFALAPAWQSSKPDVQEMLKEGGRAAGADAGRQRFRRWLVITQVSMAVMLVIGAGLLLKSFWRLRQVDPGFNPERLLVLNLSLPASKYPQWYQVTTFYNQLVEHVKGLPGVEAATIAYDHPLQSNWIDSFAIEGRPAPPPDQKTSAEFHPVGWNYFRTVGIRLLNGREFTSQDDPEHPGAVIINEAFARRYFPDEDPLGKRLQVGTPARIWNNAMPTSFEIVGIVGNVRSGGLNAEAEPAFYMPDRQLPSHNMTVLIRTSGDPLTLVPAVRGAVKDIDATQPISQISTMEEVVDHNIAQSRFNVLLMSLFGAVALVLASVGIYGLLSYMVAQRKHEIGIRMALGAQSFDVLKMVVWQGMLLALVGVVIGLVASFALTRMMKSLLYEVSASDPLTYVCVALVLLAVAFFASYIPARRATRVDPMVALRYE